MLLEEAHCLRSQVLSVCRFLNAPETVPFRASSLTTLVEMVVGGLGVTLLPEMAVVKAQSASAWSKRFVAELSGAGR